MRSDAERVRLLHQKARHLKDQQIMRIWGTLASGLLVFLIAVIAMIDVPFQSLADSGFTASSLLGESAGGYVLVAVISFVAAVVITVYCLKRKNVKR